MAQRTITTDDLTTNEITGNVIHATLTFTLYDGEGNAIENGEHESDVMDLTEFTANALGNLVAKRDLPSFISAMRPLIRIQPAGSDNNAIRKWARETHPELGVKEHGAIPADVIARYRREVTNKTESGDGGRVNGS